MPNPLDKQCTVAIVTGGAIVNAVRLAPGTAITVHGGGEAPAILAVANAS